MWGLNSQPWDQESCPLLTEPARCFKHCGSYYKDPWKLHSWLFQEILVLGEPEVSKPAWLLHPPRWSCSLTPDLTLGCQSKASCWNKPHAVVLFLVKWSEPGAGFSPRRPVGSWVWTSFLTCDCCCSGREGTATTYLRPFVWGRNTFPLV